MSEEGTRSGETPSEEPSSEEHPSGGPPSEEAPSDGPPPEGPLPDELLAMEADLLRLDEEGVLPMFPLGSVLVPSMILPLHVFEHRYRRLVRDCLSTTPEFGVVLIERGGEVGGGDVRADVGTVARIIEGAELPDGRFAIQAVGTRRIRIRRWLEDAPYPRAVVEEWPDDPGPAGSDATARRDVVVARLQRALTLQLETGQPGPDPAIELSEDPEVASHQVTALAPLGPHDRQALLVTPGTAARLERAAALLSDAIELLEAQQDLR